MCTSAAALHWFSVLCMTCIDDSTGSLKADSNPSTEDTKQTDCVCSCRSHLAICLPCFIISSNKLKAPSPYTANDNAEERHIKCLHPIRITVIRITIICPGSASPKFTRFCFVLTVPASVDSEIVEFLRWKVGVSEDIFHFQHYAIVCIHGCYNITGFLMRFL